MVYSPSGRSSRSCQGSRTQAKLRAQTTHKSKPTHTCAGTTAGTHMGSGVSHPQQLGAMGLGLREQIPGTLLMPARAGDTSCFWEHSHGHA